MRPGATPPSSATPLTTPHSSFSNNTQGMPQGPPGQPARVPPLPGTPQAQPGGNSLPPTPQGRETVRARPEATSRTNPKEWARFTRALGSHLSEARKKKREAEFPAVFQEWHRAKGRNDKHALFGRFMDAGCELHALETRIARSICQKRKRERQYLSHVQ